MRNLLFIITFLLSFTAFGQRYLDIDYIRDTSRTTTQTLPNSTGTLVNTTATQTLTGKTLTSPLIDGGVVSGSTLSNALTLTGSITGGTLNNPTISGPSISSSTESGTVSGTRNYGGAITGIGGFQINTLRLTGVTSAPYIVYDATATPTTPAAGAALYSTGTNQMGFKGQSGQVKILATSEDVNSFNQGFSASQTVTINGGAVTVSGTSVTHGGPTSVAGTWTAGAPNWTLSGPTLAGVISATQNVVMALSKGIDWSQNTGAISGTTTAKILTDYQYGTWTPSFDGSVSSPGITYSNQYGYWNKIGNFVHATARITMTAGYLTGSGNLWIRGLPFKVINTTGYTGTCFVPYATGWTTARPNNGTMRINDNIIDVIFADTATGFTQLATTNLSNTADIQISCDYQSQ